jgi:hypothetical protein
MKRKPPAERLDEKSEPPRYIGTDRLTHADIMREYESLQRRLDEVAISLNFGEDGDWEPKRPNDMP